jgi:SecD/SecF fusion protein
LAGNSKDPNFLKSIEQAKAMQAKSQKAFVDLSAEVFQKNNPGVKLASIFTNTANKGKIDYNTSDAEVLKVIKKEVDDAVDRSFNILRTRIDKFGVTNPNIQKLQGTGRILLELPGVDNPERVRKLISGIAKLEFWEVWETQEIAPYLEQFNTYLVAMEKNEKSTKTKTQQKDAKADDLTAQSTDKQDDELGVTKKEEKKEGKKEEKKEAKKEEKNKKDTAKTTEAKNEKKTDSASAQNGKDTTDKIQQSSFFGSVLIPTPEGLAAKPQDTARINEILNRSEVKNIFPSNLKFLWSVKPEEENGLLTLFAIKKARGGKAPLEGDVIIDARQDFDQKSRPEVTMQMNAIGAKNWKKLTGSNVGKRIAIVLDDNVYSAPRVQNEIPNGNSSISGSFTIEEAKDLANILKAGKLPAPTRIVEEAIIGPSLGKESINQGLISMIIGMSAVVLFMFACYSTSGSIANIALILNIFFIFGVLAQFSAVLTLPGIAGIALTIGMSVDANVLIFERIKEELSIKSLGTAIKAGFEKAYSSIIDANVTTFLIGAILYNFGSGSIKGFAVTLIIGIVCSLFSAIS